ncbi:hypothetical protein GQR58_025113 [Nymphon striatum]|nr:hypothetical protein GQR58_025113 [Nymphon striatum]
MIIFKLITFIKTATAKFSLPIGEAKDPFGLYFKSMNGDCGNSKISFAKIYIISKGDNLLKVISKFERRCGFLQIVPENGDVSRKTARCSAQQVAAILDSEDEETLGFDEDYPSDELETDSDDNVDNDNDSESDSDNENPVDRLPVRPVIGHNLDSGWNKNFHIYSKVTMDSNTGQQSTSTNDIKVYISFRIKF